MWLIDGEYVAHDVTPPFHALDRHHKLSLSAFTAEPQLGLNIFQYNSSDRYYQMVRIGILIKICLLSLF